MGRVPRWLAPVLAAGLLLPASAAAAAERPPLYLGAVVGLLIEAEAEAYAGEAGAIFDGLGGDVSTPGIIRPQLELRQCVALLDWLAIDLRQSFWWARLNAAFPLTPELDSGLDRWVVSLAAGIQLLAGSDTVTGRFSAAPALLVVVTEQRGWVGQQSTADVSAGGVLALGLWVRATDFLTLSFEQGAWLTRLPRTSRLLDDGGTVVGLALSVGFYWTP